MKIKKYQKPASNFPEINPAFEERKKFEEYKTLMSPLLNRIGKRPSKYARDNRSQNVSMIYDVLDDLQKPIRADSLFYENIKKMPEGKGKLKRMQEYKPSFYMPDINTVRSTLSELNSVDQKDLDSIMNLDWTSAKSLLKINPKLIKTFYDNKKLIDDIVEKNGFLKQGGEINKIETAKSGIHIKPENKGKFTALKKRTGKSATWYKEHGTPAQKKMAIFALNSKHWKH